jgi:MerR family transcriptional regulator, thiopeptide resistance regulator
VPVAQRIIPILVYEDIEGAHDFLVEVFGFGAGGIERDGDGQVVHGEVVTDEGPIWLHRVTDEHELASPRTMSAASGGLVVHVPDVDVHFEHARAAGANIDREPADQPYGLRDYGARDLEGHRWWFSTPLA